MCVFFFSKVTLECGKYLFLHASFSFVLFCFGGCVLQSLGTRLLPLVCTLMGMCIYEMRWKGNEMKWKKTGLVSWLCMLLGLMIYWVFILWSDEREKGRGQLGGLHSQVLSLLLFVKCMQVCKYVCFMSKVC